MNYFFVNSDADSLRGPPRPRYPILLERGFVAAGDDRAKYGEQLRALDPGDVVLLYENRVGVVAVGTVLESWDGVSHESPLYYTVAEIREFDETPAEFRLAVDWFLDLSRSPIAVATLVERIGYNPRRVIHRIVSQRLAIASLIEECRDATTLAREIRSTTALIEGARASRMTVTYERSREAVAQCKARFGTACTVCGVDFGSRYGAEFTGFIHVHHLCPLSRVGTEHLVNPEDDLRPVCPNCHSVIHHGGGLRSIEEVKGFLARKRDVADAPANSSDSVDTDAPLIRAT